LIWVCNLILLSILSLSSSKKKEQETVKNLVTNWGEWITHAYLQTPFCSKVSYFFFVDKLGGILSNIVNFLVLLL
jgi:hypothetical protein